MEQKISDLMAKEMSLTPEEIEAVDTLIPIKEFKKGQLLLKEGNIAKECYFNIKGFVRSYQILNGEERTTQFFVEGDAIASLLSYLNKTPANHYFQCIEDSTLAVLSFDNEQKLYKQHPKFEASVEITLSKNLANNKKFFNTILPRTQKKDI